jgi:hypothetical protein
MGRYYWSKKDTVEDSRSVSISFLKKHGYFSEPCSMSGTLSWKNCFGEETGSISVFVSTMYEDSYVRFYYTVTDRSTGEKTDYDYKVQLTTTPCNLGGVRYWFICPLAKNGIYCGRRVAKLYKAPGANLFGCRHCYNLSYESRNEPNFARRGGIYYPLKLDGQIEKLSNQIKRWTYKGRDTKKVRRLHYLENESEIFSRQAIARIEKMESRLS